MKLLDAVNFIMPKLGERPVTTLDQRHPTLAIILPAFDSARTEFLLDGWWFNESRTRLFPGPDKRIELGAYTLVFEADRTGVVQRGEYLYDTYNLTGEFEGPEGGLVRQDVPFEELPESAATYLQWKVLTLSTTEDLGVTQELQVWLAKEAEAKDRVVSEHLRNRRYNTKSRADWIKLRRAMRA